MKKYSRIAQVDKKEKQLTVKKLKSYWKEVKGIYGIGPTCIT